MFTGPTAIGTSADPVAAAKALVDFAKDNDKLTIVGGSMDGKTLDKAGVEALAKMPSLTNCVAGLSGCTSPGSQTRTCCPGSGRQGGTRVQARADQLQQG